MTLGPGLAPVPVERLFGRPQGKRILELGSHQGAALLPLARLGARVLAVDADADRVSAMRDLIESLDEVELRADLRHTDPADLAFLRAGCMDGCVSIGGLTGCQDLSRVFRQVHRVLRRSGTLVLSFLHPAGAGAAPSHIAGLAHPIGEVVTGLARAGFRIEELEELRAHDQALPSCFVVKCRKDGT